MNKDCSEIVLKNGQRCLIDTEDLPLVGGVKWHFVKRYAYGYVLGKNRLMHRLILGLTDKNIFVDHINGNGLDNRKCNLRKCSHLENMRNMRKRGGTSKYKGVFWDKNKNKWKANISINYRTIHLGSFDNELDAAHAYDKSAISIFGEFARVNFAAPGVQALQPTETGKSINGTEIIPLGTWVIVDGQESGWQVVDYDVLQDRYTLDKNGYWEFIDANRIKVDLNYIQPTDNDKTDNQ